MLIAEIFMNAVEFLIAWRYIKSKRREKFISATAVFSLLGVIIGVATLIIVTSVMNGFKEEFTSKVIGFNGHLSLNSIGQDFEPENIVKKIEKIDGVKAAVPVIERQALVSNNSQVMGTLVIGISQKDLPKYSLISKNIKLGNIAGFREDNSIIVGNSLAEKFRSKFNDELVILTPRFDESAFGSIPRKKTFSLVATFSSGLGEYDSRVTIIPISMAKTLFKIPVPATTILVFAENPMKLDSIREQLETIARNLFSISDWQHSNSAFMQAINVERNVIFLILTLITLVASFNVISCMIMLVRDKEREIAVLKTMGVSKNAITRIFFMIGSSIGLLGTVIGASCGLAFSLNIEQIRKFLERLLEMNLFPEEVYFLTQLPSIVDSRDVIVIICFALLTSCLATLYPARKASKIKPAEILRYV